jgi:hypothetical protein
LETGSNPQLKIGSHSFISKTSENMNAKPSPSFLDNVVEPFQALLAQGATLKQVRVLALLLAPLRQSQQGAIVSSCLNNFQPRIEKICQAGNSPLFELLLAILSECCENKPHLNEAFCALIASDSTPHVRRDLLQRLASWTATNAPRPDTIAVRLEVFAHRMGLLFDTEKSQTIVSSVLLDPERFRTEHSYSFNGLSLIALWLFDYLKAEPGLVGTSNTLAIMNLLFPYLVKPPIPQVVMDEAVLPKEYPPKKKEETVKEVLNRQQSGGSAGIPPYWRDRKEEKRRNRERARLASQTTTAGRRTESTKRQKKEPYDTRDDWFNGDSD